MTSDNLTYHEAEAILRQMAGPTGWNSPDLSGLSVALVQAQAVDAAGPGTAEVSRAAPINRRWTANTFRNLVESAPDAIMIFDDDGAIALVNAKAERLFGYRRAELLGQSLGLFVLAAAPDQRARAWWRGRQSAIELQGRRKDGRLFPIEVNLSPLETETETLITSTIRDISDRKRLEARYRNLVEGIPAVTFLAALDEAGNELYVSPQIEQLLGFSQQEWLDDPVLWYTRLHADDRERWHIEFAQTCATAAPFRSVYRFVARDGRIVWVQGEAQVVRDSAGRPLFLQGVAFDITDRKAAEDALRRSRDELEHLVHRRTEELARANRELQSAVKEKESLLKEIHHRVKNNLQIVSSLLNLQSASIQDAQTLQAFRESQNRVRSMSLIHEKLYQSSNLAGIAFAQYVRDLAAYLFRSYGVHDSHIRLTTNIGDDVLTLDRAIPCGLIVTELISNSLKHAFADGRAGEVTISLHADSDGVRVLSVSDDGVGLPEGLDLEQTPSLGLQLVRTLASQLETTLDVRRHPGTSFTIRFREPPIN
jgi:PAS domain S-box-containing protein